MSEPVDRTEAAPLGTGGTEKLRPALTRKQVSMMGLGSAIGAGLFVGSGNAINLAGPAVLVSYAVAGLIVISIMAMLAEQVAAHPSSGAFSTFAQRAFGPTAGATVGWLYWIQLVVVIAAEATGAAAVLSAWVPGVPQWAWVLVFIVGFTVVNLLGVSNYGAFEYWFAFVKVTAIVLFLIVGVLAIAGLLPGHEAIGLANLVAHGGFAPTGITGIAGALLIVIFAFGGTELVSIAAAESEDPSGNIRRTVRSVMVRILVFYIGSIFVIVAVLPWDSETVASGPFAAVLHVLRLPGTDLLMSLLVVIALLSAMNANIYGSSRMLFSLGERDAAPGFVRRTSANGVPRIAVSASVAFSFVAVGLNWAWPEAVLPALLNAVGSTILIVWVSIAASQLVLRRRADRAGETLPLRLWGYPWITWITLALLLAVFVLVMFEEASRNQLLATVVLVSALAGVIALTKARHRRG